MHMAGRIGHKALRMTTGGSEAGQMTVMVQMTRGSEGGQMTTSGQVMTTSGSGVMPTSLGVLMMTTSRRSDGETTKTAHKAIRKVKLLHMALSVSCAEAQE